MEDLVTAGNCYFKKNSPKNKQLLLDALQTISISHIPALEKNDNDISYWKYYADNVFIIILFILPPDAVIPVFIF
jgi:hypothetical protein